MAKIARKHARRLRSQLWFDNPDNPGMTALYLERYLNYGLTGAECARASRSSASRRPVPVCRRATGTILSSPSACARNPRCRRHRLRVSVSSDPGDRQTADCGARPQPGLSRPGRGPVRLSARRRRADDRLRQDNAGLPDGGGDGEHSRHRSVRRADAQRLVEGRAAGSGTVIWKAARTGGGPHRR